MSGVLPRARMGYIDEHDGRRSYFLALDYLRPGELCEVHFALPGGVFWKATEGSIVPAEARVSTREELTAAFNTLLERIFPSKRRYTREDFTARRPGYGAEWW